METQSLRAYLSKLEANRQLLVCEKEVDPKFEMGALVKKFNGTRTVLFPKIKGHKISAVGGICGNRDRYAELLGVKNDEIIFPLMNAVANPKPYKVVASGPVKENVIKRNIDLCRMVPAPTFHEKDSNPYITASIVVIRDLETGRFFTSVRRMQVLGGNRLSILVESPMMYEQMMAFEKINKPLEVAIILGYDPILILASQANSQIFGLDKYEVDSAIRGESLELVKCETIDMLVPAYAEMVFEGSIIPKVREKEGPFGEMAGYYGGGTMEPIVEISAVCHRNNPIFQFNFPSSHEHVLPNGLMREMFLYQQIKNIVSTVKSVHLPTIGGCRFHALISIKKTNEGDGKSAILAALSSNKDVKHVVVVDDDIDIFNREEVEWAIATRVQADLDVVIIPGAKGSSLEPTHEIRGVSAKMGIDATAPLGSLTGKFERTKIPNWDEINPEDYFPKGF